MAIEFERKFSIQEDQLFGIKAWLHSIDQSPVVEKQVDTYYDNQYLVGFASADHVLRIREIEGAHNAVVCHKSRVYDAAGTFLYSCENETLINSVTSMDALFKAIGFVVAVVITKERYIYSYGRWLIALDNVEGLGYFLEFELSLQEDRVIDVAQLEENILSIIREMHIGELSIVKAGYRSLLKKVA